jgi:hypothetical protein
MPGICSPVVGFFLFGTFGACAAGFSVVSKEIGLKDQPGWQLWFNPSDSPEGAYLGTLKETETSLKGTMGAIT